MMLMTESKKTGCSACVGGTGLGFEITMAFQPILDLSLGTVFAHEALVRGRDGESAATILAQVNEGNRYLFDQTCRVRAINLAAKLGMTSALSINFMPNAVYRPEHCIRTTLEAAQACGFPSNRIIFEITEGEKVDNPAHVRHIIEYYKREGFLTAIDDFGAGYAGLSLLADFRPDIVKLDMGLIRGIDTDRGRRAIVNGVLQVCFDLEIMPVAEGVETKAEVEVLRGLGIDLFQGYYFAKPAFESLAEVAAEKLTV